MGCYESTESNVTIKGNGKGLSIINNKFLGGFCLPLLLISKQYNKLSRATNKVQYMYLIC